MYCMYIILFFPVISDCCQVILTYFLYCLPISYVSSERSGGDKRIERDLAAAQDGHGVDYKMVMLMVERVLEQEKVIALTPAKMKKTMTLGFFFVLFCFVFFQKILHKHHISSYRSGGNRS